MRVLVFVDYYLPAYKAGGPVVSVSRIVERLSDELDFYVFTRDRDLGDAEAFPDLPKDRWIGDHPKIFYASPDRLGIANMLAAIRESEPDSIYLNSYFSGMTRSVLLLRRLGFIRNIPVTLAPRGEFSQGALALKSLKKKVYKGVAALLGFHRGIIWHASAVPEEADIKREISERVKVVVIAPDLIEARTQSSEIVTKRPGRAHFVFLSRISPKKNLRQAIELLAGIRGDASLTIYGPVEDREYWALCERRIADLPANVRVDYAGPIVPDEVICRLSKEQFFLLPTLGENFGHVIAEALAAGLPTLISDTTPWLDLEPYHAGWAIPLAADGRWRETIQRCVDMDDSEYQKMRQAAADYARRKAEAGADLDANRRLFQFKSGRKS